MTPAVEISGLAKSYGKTTVLAGIDLSVPTGTIFALLGPNGAGKTTLINILSTLIPPDRGRATILGHDVVTEADLVRRSISLTGQYAAVDDLLTGTENLQLMARLSGLRPADARRRSAELLADFDLVDAGPRRVKTYSGGMRRRLDLAISLIITPPVLFLDEPTTGLDTRSRQALWQAIRGLLDVGTTIFLTTQYLEEADQLADRIAVINNGQVVAQGSAAELKAQVGTELVEVHDASGRLLAEHQTDGTIDGLQAVLAGLDRSAYPDAQITLRKPTMDDVFLALTGDAPADQNRRELVR
ncbi:ATP-binding cassette domain-containing protein [Microlunatus parietis]|uniref:Daunorubicin resistance ABC transporter ATP-binding subunit n=1 Tax=Microlunatus parietis TaxID=682979 RepID=A0A7Y9IEQ7_9ACTN|nr:ATP-binding cassette domain-containing protein [Microlunatus parietis]NYE75367.1 daunorubicin resistance ABC transporter ATP-binding subunit [Microlunatus parietis]